MSLVDGIGGIGNALNGLKKFTGTEEAGTNAGSESQELENNMISFDAKKIEIPVRQEDENVNILTSEKLFQKWEGIMN
jgi:hypothetical protein